MKNHRREAQLLHRAGVAWHLRDEPPDPAMPSPRSERCRQHHDNKGDTHHEMASR